MKNSKVIVDQDTINKIARGNRRHARLVDGLNDSRFVTRAVEDKTKYKRKSKHKAQY